MAGKAQEEQYGRAGTYILADGLVNGYPHWLKTDGSQVIWLDKVSSAWFVASKKNLGTNIGGISGPDGKDSYPNEIKQGWKYWDGELFNDAPGSDIIFNALGMYSFQIFAS